jgi:hypothetical protein
MQLVEARALRESSHQNFRKLPLTVALCINRSVQGEGSWRTGPAGTLNRRGFAAFPQRFVPIVPSHPRHLRAMLPSMSLSFSYIHSKVKWLA